MRSSLPVLVARSSYVSLIACDRGGQSPKRSGHRNAVELRFALMKKGIGRTDVLAGEKVTEERITQQKSLK